MMIRWCSPARAAAILRAPIDMMKIEEIQPQKSWLSAAWRLLTAREQVLHRTVR